MAPVVWILILNILVVGLVYVYLGKIEALIMATAPVWTIISTSAWNPYPMPWLMVLILISLKHLKPEKASVVPLMALIGLCVGLSFHFSSAFAVFYLFTIPLILAYRWRVHRQSLSLQSALAGISAFMIPFIPQALFEIKHNFMEVKAIISYLQQPPANQAPRPLVNIVQTYLGEVRLAVLPEFEASQTVNLLLFFSCLSLLATGVYFLVKNHQKLAFLPETLILTVIPLVGFSKLHFNVWYVSALLPLAVVLVGQIVRALPIMQPVLNNIDMF